jgi:hypothetical protein
MICADTVRRLRPSAFEQLNGTFQPAADAPPPGWVRFDMRRSLADENEVVRSASSTARSRSSSAASGTATTRSGGPPSSRSSTR